MPSTGSEGDATAEPSVSVEETTPTTPFSMSTENLSCFAPSKGTSTVSHCLSPTVWELDRENINEDDVIRNLMEEFDASEVIPESPTLSKFTDAAKRNFGEEFEVTEPSETDGSKPPKKRKMSASRLMLEYFYEHNINDQQALLDRPRQEWSQWAAMTNFLSLAANYYSLVKASWMNYKLLPDIMNRLLLHVPELNDGGKIHRLLLFQNWTMKKIKYFCYCLIQVADKNMRKKNTLYVHGKPSAGKSALIESFVRTFFDKSFGSPDNNLRTSFKWNDCVGVRCILWEEPKVNVDIIEDVKKILGGQRHTANAKYKSGVEVPSTPVFCTSNHNPSLTFQADYNAMKERITAFYFPNNVNDFEGFEWPIVLNDWLDFFFFHEDVIKMCKNKKWTFEE